MRSRFRCVFWFLLPLLAQRVAAESRPEVVAVKLFVREPGLYRVSYEELAAVGWPAGLPSARLELRQAGRAAAIDVEDGGDGSFGAGDSIVFVGDRLAGEHGYYNEFTAFNVYRLALAAGTGRRFVPLAVAEGVPVGLPSTWQRRFRFEKDDLLLRYPNQGIADDELWYWAKLSHIDPQPFEVEVDLGRLSFSGSVPLSIEIELRGWSVPARKPGPAFADHCVELLWDGRQVGAAQWSGFDRPIRLTVAELPAELATPGAHRLGLRVPARPVEANGDPLVDVVVLNWVEVVVPQSERLAPGDEALRVEPLGWERRGAEEGGAAELSLAGRLALPAGAAWTLYSEAGESARLEAFGTDQLVELRGAGRAAPIWIAAQGKAWRQVDGLEVDLPSSWHTPEHQADYLIVAHPRLLEAVRPLAEAHRRRGLRVVLVDVRDIYDEWNSGIVHPRAIRDFVSYAFHSWRGPAPRFLLLVGDASWDGKNDRANDESPDWTFRLTDRAGFIKNGSTPYGDLHARNLIPAWDYGTHEGHAAGDNGYVAVDGEDELPDLAVGRFPVTEPAEVEAIVAKTVSYLAAPPLGDWRNRLLWVTNEEPYWQQSSDRLAALLGGRGFGARKVYPRSELPAAAQDQAVLRGAFDDGALLVHFVGHGGRYIWRTGPPDLATQRDLFDLKDVERLAANSRLPLVVSLTCYSAPFDHPTADSIGEKLLRQPGRGAIGVFAASWRNAPSEVWSRALVDELLLPGSVGEALQRVKRKMAGGEFVRQYNLLGDPALELALAREAIALRPAREVIGGLEVEATLPAGLGGRLVVEWIDAKGDVLVREEASVAGRAITLRPPAPSPAPFPTPALVRPAAVRVYAWDEATGRDARGGVTLPVPARPDEDSAAAKDEEKKR